MRFVDNLLNDKTVILLNLAENRLILANSAYDRSAIFRAILQGCVATHTRIDKRSGGRLRKCTFINNECFMSFTRGHNLNWREFNYAVPCSFLFPAIIIFGVSGFIMVVVSLFTKKIPRGELGGLTWPTINEPPISHGAIGEEDEAGKAENGAVAVEAIELLDKNGKIQCVLLRSLNDWFKKTSRHFLNQSEVKLK